MDESGEVVVRGRVVFPDGGRPPAAARLVIRIEDVSRADAPSTTVTERVLEDVRLPQGHGVVDGSLPFEIRMPNTSIDPAGRYSVRVHVDVSGSGTVTPGDFVSTRSYPVTSEQRDAVVEVHPV